ncbi:hypothetical protein Taro_033792 [Colocasia esculenta]|uniref:Uncharacterized protein n=1 Tax=Colocasia esculenta TaxID=4460 RepID=A0A843VUR7_COLES|nr:hypothetical protein [Colocasia esculenta]
METLPLVTVRRVHRRLILDPGPDPHVSSERVWPDYGPTPDLPKQFQGRKERGSEKKDWLACAGVRQVGYQLEHARSLEYSLNRLPRMGVPGNEDNL